MAKEPDIFTGEWYPWYPERALTSEAIDRLTLTEEAAYRRALDKAWLKGSIPADPKEAAKVIGKGCTVKIAKRVLELFSPQPGSRKRVVNLPQEKIRKEQKEKHEKRVKAGRERAAQREAAKANKNGAPVSNAGAINNQYPTELELELDSSKEERKEIPSGISKESQPPQPKASETRKPTRLPQSFHEISPEMWAWLAENIPDLRDPKGVHAKWVEHWANEPGVKGMKLSWMLTWQKGMRLARGWQDEDDAARNRDQRRGHGNDPPSLAEKIRQDEAERAKFTAPPEDKKAA